MSETTPGEEGPTFRHYVALGDSISIDLYPGLDVAEREDLPLPPGGLGAASLLYRNDDHRWPEFEGRDLATHYPKLQRTDLTQDGATTGTVLGMQLPRVPEDLEGPVLVTLTAGGNDLLALLSLYPGLEEGPLPSGPEGVGDILRALRRIVQRLQDELPDSLLIVGTVYDPTDGTGDLGDGEQRPDAIDALHAYNERVREVADQADARVAPIHDHFLGHGLTEPDPARRWYWHRNPIEPSAHGASEVRRLWVEEMGLHGL